MDETLASQLTPKFKEEPKWNGLFKLSLDGDDGIPINKRGSGVRRLILLNFFRAEAERQKNVSHKKDVIYAIEEPETAQHPNNQKMLANAFKELVDSDKAQVILTTHVPGFAELIPENSLRFIETVDGKKVINEANDETIIKIADALGVYPTPVSDQEKKVLVCVEGVHDVTAICDFSEIISSRRPELINFKSNKHAIVIPLGGSTLKDWVQHRYLQKLGFPEVHIYDRDDKDNPKYQNQCDEVNLRTDGSKGFLTNKREMENYIHPDVIETVFGIRIQYGDWEDIPRSLARIIHEQNSSKPWKDVDKKDRKDKESRVKKRLNNEVIKHMTFEQLQEIDTDQEIENWLAAITKLCKKETAKV